MMKGQTPLPVAQIYYVVQSAATHKNNQII
jgi:hypothetical protein